MNLDLAPGECVCLGGPSGSGKTRLLRALADLDPHSGSHSPEWARAGRLSTERVAPALSPCCRPRVPGGLRRVGEHMHELYAEELVRLGLPDEAPRWPVERLSAGEKQRLALLRLTAGRQPAVLLLDEPTSNLDPASVERVEPTARDRRRSAAPE